jgi:aryl-alcohol dehydrogenase-like predicted oxidoreductase
VIAGATKPEQVNANASAAGWKLTPEDRAQIEAILSGPAGSAGTGSGPRR